MFLKSLKITKENSVIRNIIFRKGINLIVDNSEESVTGNNVGKTTVLKLIDFCFGAKKKIIWEDPERTGYSYDLVKDYLIDNEIFITLTLTEDLDNDDAKELVIERNFLSRNKKIIRVNGEQINENQLETKLREILFPQHRADKPTIRQIISHNIRYNDFSLNHTLKTLNNYTSDAEYESLYLFLFGCNFNDGSGKQELLEKIRQEELFKNRLEKQETKSAYQAALSLINNDIDELNAKKSKLNLNENFEADLNNLNNVKYRINKLSSENSRLGIRKSIITESLEDLDAAKSNVDTNLLYQIYEQTTNALGDLQKSFEDMLRYHNEMIIEKKRFISKELPSLQSRIDENSAKLKELLNKEKKLSSLVAKSDSFKDLEDIISELNKKHILKGEYESIIRQLNEVENNIKAYRKSLETIDHRLFSDDFEAKVKSQVDKFNKHFAKISDILYNEKFAIKYDITINRKGQKLYKFSAFNTNFSSCKKQGEISCFDIAYILFADEEDIPCMHFILNDKKELMHDNQLTKIADLVNDNNIQFVASILKDKLPKELNREEYFILQLSENSKLFKI